jgi:clan AA aspartic protease
MGRLYGERMGQFYQRVTITGDKSATVRMLVDTGATFSMISGSMARALGIELRPRTYTTTLADGRRRKVNYGIVDFSILGREAPGTILVGDVAEPILGMEILETLGLTVDPRRRRLRKSHAFAIRA